MRLTQALNGMVKIEAVNEEGNAFDHKNKPHEPEPVGAAGQTMRD